MAEHTPGIAIVGDGCAMCGAPVDYEERMADLLAALEDGLTCIGNCEEHGIYADDMSRYDAARAAIAKAKGES
jgi:hypothetical protein